MALWYLYLIECEDGSLYTGIALDPLQRFAEHQNGRGARYTRSHKPLRLIGTAALDSKSAALKAEIALKKLPKTHKISALLKLSDASSNTAVAAS